MILDTNGLSALAEGDPGLEPILRDANRIAIPVIVLGEYLYSVRQSSNWRRYEAWLDQYLPTFEVLPVEERTANAYAAIRGELKRAGTPIPANDYWIAALCRQHSFPILSRDRHFDLVPELRRIGW